MDTRILRRLQQVRVQWAQWDAQLRGIGAHAARQTRRWLAVGYLVCVAADPAAALLLPETAAKGVWFVGFMVAMVLFAVMSNATGNVADAPDHAVDEVLARIRDRYRSRAYGLLVICVVTALAVLILALTFAPRTLPTIVQSVFWPLFLVCVGLPALLTCWSLPRVDEPAE
jgi:Na+/proline symporter